MRFRHFLLSEGPADPMGAPPMGGPPGGDPMSMAGGAPPMGGGDPSAMGGAPPMGGPPAPSGPQPQPVPQHANVWDVLEDLLTGKPIEQEAKLKKYKSQKDLSAQNSPPAGGDPTQGGMGGPPGGALFS